MIEKVIIILIMTMMKILQSTIDITVSFIIRNEKSRLSLIANFTSCGTDLRITSCLLFYFHLLLSFFLLLSLINCSIKFIWPLPESHSKNCAISQLIKGSNISHLSPLLWVANPDLIYKVALELQTIKSTQTNSI